MEKNTILAIVLSIAVLIFYQVFFVKPVSPPPKPEQVKEALKEVATVKPVKPVTAAAMPQEEKTVRVETGLYAATFSTKGGTIKSFHLKGYTDKDGLSIVILKDRGAYPALGVGMKDDFSLSNENFKLIGKDLQLTDTEKSGSIIFEYAGKDYSLRRTYTFYHDTYKFDLKDESAGFPEYELTLGTDFGIYSRKDDFGHIGPVILSDSDRIELTSKKLQEKQTFRLSRLKWIAQEDKYFFASIIPQEKIEEVRAWAHENSEVISLKGSSGVNNFMIYAGPKDHDALKKLGVGLEHIIDFGFFSIISRPLFWFLKFIHRFIGNYGWAIVVLTIIVRIPFIPIINKGQRSMKKLQEAQPRMAEIREKYKKDPKRMQKEMMEVYKKYNINPMGGCLPILLQIPVFFALYKVLATAIELRNAPYLLWITDLSQKDPYYILPIVMGITMVIQQKMTPSAGDPRQQKLMMFMPVIFTFMFLNFASGLVLYWLVNNILSIIQQMYINKKAVAPSH